MRMSSRPDKERSGLARGLLHDMGEARNIRTMGNGPDTLWA